MPSFREYISSIFNRNITVVGVGLILILWYCIPYYYPGSDSYHTIADNLDSSIPMYVVLGHSDQYWSISNNSYLQEIMPGAIPRNTLPAPFKLTSLLFHFCNPYTAFVLNLITTLFLGFAGMYLLCNTFILKNRNKVISLIIALAFALIKCQTTFEGATFVIMPFVLYGTLKYFTADHKDSYIPLSILFLAPFCASLVLSYIFIYGYLFLISCYFLIKRTPVIRFIGFHVTALSGIVIANLGMIRHMLFPPADFVSQRDTRLNIYNGFQDSIIYLKDFLWKEDNFHQHSQHHIILGCCIILIVLSRIAQKRLSWEVILIGSVLLLNALLATILNTSLWGNLTGDISFFRSFDFNRFASLNATWWFLLFAATIAAFMNVPTSKTIWVRNISLMLVTINLVYVVKYNYTYIHSAKAMVYAALGKTYNVPSGTVVTFNEYYAPGLFQSVKSLTKDQPCVAVGLVPGVLQFNGITTVDGYANIYRNEYRSLWGTIIHKELTQMPGEEHKFYTWGNRCYLYLHELEQTWDYRGELLAKTTAENITVHPEINFELLKQTGCRFIVSTVAIDNSNIQLVSVLNNSDYPYIIRIYKLV
jgi:hypothetical protein